MRRETLVCAALFGLSGVALGAFGAHALTAHVTADSLTTWRTAVQYQLFHAAALLGMAALGAGDTDATGPLRWAARLMVLGVVLFSGSLYLLTVGGPRWLGPVTPLGGLSLLAAWSGVLVAAFRRGAAED